MFRSQTLPHRPLRLIIMVATIAAAHGIGWPEAAHAAKHQASPFARCYTDAVNQRGL